MTPVVVMLAAAGISLGILGVLTLAAVVRDWWKARRE